MRVVPGIESGEITVYIQVPDRPEILEVPDGAALGGKLQSDLEQRVANRMQVVGKAIAGVCATIYGSVEQTIENARPDEITLEFGITLGGKTGVPFVTEGSAEGTFKVSATWTRVAKDTSKKGESKGKSEQTMGAKLANYDKHINPRLKLDFVQLAVPEGDEVWWVAKLTERYHSQVGGGASDFAVSLNHLMQTCAFTFTLGAHDAAYRGLMQESRSSGDGSGVRVKVVDSGLSSACGISATSQVNILDPSNPTDVEDQVGHGTAVSAIIHELAPKAQFLIYKVAGTGPIIEWDVLAALADDDTADIVNLSLAFGLSTVRCPTCGRLSHSARSAVFEGTLRHMEAINLDTLIVAAAGNGGSSPLVYPARFRETIAAGSVDSTATRSASSNYGNTDHKSAAHDSLFFAAGGSATESVGYTSPGGKTYSGTSFAAAYPSGLLAKLRSDVKYKASAKDLLDKLRKSANQNPKMVGHVVRNDGNGLLQI